MRRLLSIEELYSTEIDHLWWYGYQAKKIGRFMQTWSANARAWPILVHWLSSPTTVACFYRGHQLPSGREGP